MRLSYARAAISVSPGGVGAAARALPASRAINCSSTASSCPARTDDPSTSSSSMTGLSGVTSIIRCSLQDRSYTVVLTGPSGLLSEQFEGLRKAVLDHVGGGGGSGRGADLGVDPLDVVACGLGRDAESAGDLSGGGGAGDEQQHLDLALGKPGGPGRGAAGWVSGAGQHRFDGDWLEFAAVRVGAQ